LMLMLMLWDLMVGYKGLELFLFIKHLSYIISFKNNVLYIYLSTRIFSSIA